MKNSLTDRVISLALLGISVFLYLKAEDFPSGGSHFPKFALGFIILLSMLMFVSSFFRQGSRSKKNERHDATKKARAYGPFAIFLLFIIYLIGAPLLGLYTSTTILAGVSMALLGVRDLKLYLIVLPLIFLSFYGFFEMLLKVPFPRGILF
jgi:hypothetical protein